MSFFTQFSDIATMGAALRAGKTSARELTQDALNAIAQSQLNAFIQVDADLSLAQADHADALLQSGKATPLTGIPIAHKDVIVTQHWRTTAASKMLANYVSPFDATLVTQLQQAGAVSLGKLNCDEFAMGSDSTSSYFGPTKNPWNLSRTPGGSSGGSAAAVAAGLIMAATGSDTGGSIRQPAAHCGITGIKPTYGTVSRYGVIAYASSMDQAGPLARSAKDALALLEVMSGFDANDPTSLEQCGKQKNTGVRVRDQFTAHSDQFDAHGDQPLKGVRIGVPTEFFTRLSDADSIAAIESALALYESLGATRVEVSLPRTQQAVPAYYVITPAEASSNLSRFDGVRFGHRSDTYHDLQSMISNSRTEAFGPEVVRRILTGTYVLCEGYYDAYYLQAQRVRRLIANDFQSAFEQCDVIMGPVTTKPAQSLDHQDADPTADWREDVFTLCANLAGLPAMSHPCGFTAQHLPIGLQLIGNYFNEGQLLAIADRFQQHSDWHQRIAGTK
ncbi:Asp-tRNA(Asn)/Glu-tRNA(Gln) amidotransferase subunit GatA [Paenalcaligenes hominis]|uniref:Asp-tRNA(Asn)/Glu-tRNA(Gln) amidotransferase subunit GatA n=1 Tax=Paenalcaligenes hominis TaxID=643674 RepID=UPI00352321C3